MQHRESVQRLLDVARRDHDEAIRTRLLRYGELKRAISDAIPPGPTHPEEYERAVTELARRLGI